MQEIILKVLELGSEFAAWGILVALGMAINWVRGLKHEWAVRKIVEDGILFAQQAYRHYDGEEKKMAAIGVIVGKLEEKGLKVTEDQILVILEATLKRLKKDFGELWNEE